MAHLRNNAQSRVKKDVHKILKEQSAENFTISEWEKRERHRRHVEELEDILKFDLYENDRLYWTFWLEEVRARAPKWHLSDRVYSQLVKRRRIEKAILAGHIPRLPPSATAIEATKAFIARWRARVAAEGSTKTLAPFLLDPSLLPKKPPTRKDPRR